MLLYWTSFPTSILVFTVLCGFCRSQETEVKPQLDTEPVNMTVVEGDDTVLPCSAANLGTSQVTWRGPRGIISIGMRILTSDKTKFQVLNPYLSEFNLQIRKVRSSEAGYYNCSIPNPPQVKSILLLVSVPPSIVDSELQDNYEVLEGTDFSITCHARGFPKPTVKWLRKIIKSESELLLGGETLVIPSITKSDSGNYICVASNEIKHDATRTIMINVTYPPKVTVRTKKISQYLGRETILSCMVESYPLATIIWSFGGKEVRYSWKYKITTNTEANGQGLETQLTILGIEMSDEGTYQCLATNSHGSDEGTIVLHALTPPIPAISSTMETPPTSSPPTSPAQRSTRINEIFITDASSGNGGEYVYASPQYVIAVLLVALLASL